MANNGVAMAYSRLQPWLDEAVLKLQDAFDPEQVILFGSWARGTAIRHSDIDLFMLWECDLKPLERIHQILLLLKDAPYPLEPIAYTRKELAERCDRPFVRQLLAEGIVLHERRKAEVGSPAVASAGD